MKGQDMGWIGWALKSLGICTATALAVWVTKSGWALLGLCFLSGWRSDYCDKCKEIMIHEKSKSTD